MRRQKPHEPEENNLQFSIALIESLHDSINKSLNSKQDVDASLVNGQIIDAQKTIEKLESDYKKVMRTHGTYLLQSEQKRLKEIEKKIQALVRIQTTFISKVEDAKPACAAAQQPRTRGRKKKVVANEEEHIEDSQELIPDAQTFPNSIDMNFTKLSVKSKLKTQALSQQLADSQSLDTQQSTTASMVKVRSRSTKNSQQSQLFDSQNQLTSTPQLAPNQVKHCAKSTTRKCQSQLTDSQIVNTQQTQNEATIAKSTTSTIQQSQQLVDSQNMNTQETIVQNEAVVKLHEQEKAKTKLAITTTKVRIHKQSEYVHASKLPVNFWQDILSYKPWYDDIDNWD